MPRPRYRRRRNISRENRRVRRRGRARIIHNRRRSRHVVLCRLIAPRRQCTQCRDRGERQQIMRPDWLIRIESRRGRGRRRLDDSGWRRLRLRLRGWIDLRSERPFFQCCTRGRINQTAIVRIVAMHFGEFAHHEVAAMDSVAVDEGARPMVLGGIFEQRQLRLRIRECGMK